MKLKVVRQRNDNDELFLTLTGEMTVYSVVKLKEIVNSEFQNCSGITMNIAGVGEADTSGFQLLLFLKREAKLRGKSFKITEVSPVIRSISDLYKEMI